MCPLRTFTIATLPLTLLIATGVLPAAGESPRFELRLADGQRAVGERLSDWSEGIGAARLDDSPLLAGANSFVWLRDRRLAPDRLRQRSPRVEFSNGDVLPGEMLAFVPASQTGLSSLPAHLLLRPAGLLEPPPVADAQQLRVRVDWIRRLVLHERASPPLLQPATLHFRDGRAAHYSAIRMSAEGVSVLTEDGRAEAQWSELAEVHLPAEEDAWRLVCRELAALTPQLRSEDRIVTMATVDGFRVTASTNRLQHRVLGKPDELERWVHGLHPVWSLDTLWIPARQVWLRTSHPPTQLPLSRLQPTRFEHRPLLGSQRLWRRDRSVDEQLLRAGGEQFGWGFGVHAASRLEFSLPPEARALRGEVGLDDDAGQGGCVRAEILAGSRSLFHSDFLLGGRVVSFGPLPLSGEERTLSLVVDAAHEGRPEGADPLDIRDLTNWLDISLELDGESLARAIRQSLPSTLDAWEGWQVQLPPDTVFQNRWDELTSSPGAFRLALRQGSPLILHRQIRRRAADRFLIVAVSREGDADHPRVEVLVDGNPAGRGEVPRRDKSRPEAPPLIVPLDGPLGQKADITVVVSGAGETFLRWDLLAVAEHRPQLYDAFDEQSIGQAVADADQAYNGTRAVALRQGQRIRFELNGLRVRYRPQWNEFRQLRLAVRKTEGGRVGMTIHRVEGPPMHFDLGHGPPIRDSARRIWAQPLLDQWQVVIRDICADLNQGDVAALEFESPDPGVAWLDEIYFARNSSDLAELPPALSPPWNEPEQRKRLVEALRVRGGAATVRILLRDGRTLEGALLSPAGDVLTAGHALPGQPEKVSVLLADGRQFDGETRGVFRDRDWGLVRLDSAERLPAASRLETAHLPLNSSFVELGVGGEEALAVRARPGLDRLVQGAGAPQAPLGRPLWDAAGQLAGLKIGAVRGTPAVADSPRNLQLYTTLFEFTPQLEALQAGERWGRWPLGLGPQLGIRVKAGSKGAEIVELTAAAKAAGLQIGEQIVAAQGQPVWEAWSLHDALAELDAGAEVSLEVLRGEATRVAKLRLTH